MRFPIRLSSLCLGGLLVWANMGWAEPNAGQAATSSQSDGNGQDKGVAKKEAAKHSAGTIPNAKDRPVVTRNTVTIAGQRVSYVAETGMLPLLKADGASRASIFYVAYMKQDAGSMEHRPITFCFNGGPGSSSVWLHLGALGPRRVRLNEKDITQPAPLGLVDNEFSILNVTDLVFIDPVATGFSRPTKEDDAKQFFGESSDIEFGGRVHSAMDHAARAMAFAKISLRGELWRFPRRRIGAYLHSRYGMTLRGLVLVSGLLELRMLGRRALPGVSCRHTRR